MAQPDERAADDSYTFDPFARHQFYTDVNRALVERTISYLDRTHPPGETLRIVELASGTGAVTELILDALAAHGRTAQLVGVEPSAAAMRLAEERLEGRQVSFARGDAADLWAAMPRADAAFFCNAIHLIADKDTCVAALASVLDAGGVLACNTTFYEGAYVAGSQPFYYALTRHSIGWLREHHPDVRLAHRGKSTARQWLSAGEYDELVARHGLAVTSLEEEPVRFPLRAIQDIGHYRLFIEGALPGVPLAIGAEALEAAAARAFADLRLDFVPRNWLQVIARRGE
jgi:ubiquinone/menaquinone biosynthesis C-methylase UbiE